MDNLKIKRKNKIEYSTTQLTILIVLRLIVGYHFLYEGLDKLLSYNWTAAGFLNQANWIFAGMFHSIADSPTL